MIRTLRPTDWPRYLDALRLIQPNLKSVSHSEVFVVDTGDRLAGTATLLFDGTRAQLDRLAVLPAQQGRCLSRELVDHVRRRARDLGFATIDADPIDERVAAMLRRMGFATTNTATLTGEL